MPAADAPRPSRCSSRRACASRFHGLRVPRGSRRGEFRRHRLADDRPRRPRATPRRRPHPCPSASPSNSGEPISVGMSTVSMMSLMPTGMPSIGESGLPARQRSVERVGGRARAHRDRRATKAPTFGSQRVDRRRGSASRKCARRVAAPAAKASGGSQNRVASRAVLQFGGEHRLMPLQCRCACGAALAGDHRGAQQKLPRARGIGGDGAQLVEIALADVRHRCASSRFLFSIDCSCTNSIATVRR